MSQRLRRPKPLVELRSQTALRVLSLAIPPNETQAWDLFKTRSNFSFRRFTRQACTSLQRIFDRISAQSHDVCARLIRQSGHDGRRRVQTGVINGSWVGILVVNNLWINGPLTSVFLRKRRTGRGSRKRRSQITSQPQEAGVIWGNLTEIQDRAISYLAIRLDASTQWEIAMNTTLESARFLSTKELSGLLGIPEGTLRQWRCSEVGPKWHKLRGTVRYDKADVENFLHESERIPSVRAHMEEHLVSVSSQR